MDIWLTKDEKKEVSTFIQLVQKESEIFISAFIKKKEI